MLEGKVVYIERLEELLTWCMCTETMYEFNDVDEMKIEVLKNLNENYNYDGLFNYKDITVSETPESGILNIWVEIRKVFSTVYIKKTDSESIQCIGYIGKRKEE